VRGRALLLVALASALSSAACGASPLARSVVPLRYGEAPAALASPSEDAPFRRAEPVTADSVAIPRLRIESLSLENG
jgi:hypothetical protein